MTWTELSAGFDPRGAGEECAAWIRRWYPENRSITGDGLRRQLASIAELIPIEQIETPTGAEALDWTVPKEWNIRDAYVKDRHGKRVIDFQQHNLHVMGYSVPVHKTLSLAELKTRCFTLPEQPDAIPYRTSYFREDWAFCVAHNVLEALPEGDYEVCIDSSLEAGALSYGECILPGESEETFLISAHICHPSLANDNLSGVAVAVWLARALQQIAHRFTYRFVFAPGTIGAITWLDRNRDAIAKIRHGLILACIGDEGAFNYKQSRRGDAEIDRAAALALRESAVAHAIHPFTPYGYDERQYCSPGFNLPVACFMRSRPGHFPEYHTSEDNLDIISSDALGASIERLLHIIEILEGNESYQNLKPYGEPQLGKRGLYSAIGGRNDAKSVEMALLWVLNYSDGEGDLVAIAERSGLPFRAIREAANALIAASLLAPVETLAEDEEVAWEEAPDTSQEADEAQGDDLGESGDFWDDFLEDDGNLDLSNESLAEFFQDETRGEDA